MTTRMVANINGTLTYKNDTIAQKFYRLNGPQDIATAVGGTQAYFWDTLVGDNGGSQPYAKYRVLWSKFCVEFNNYHEDTNPPIVGVVVAVGLNGVDSNAGGLELLMQRGGSKFVPLGCKSGSNNQRSIKGFVSHKDLLGVKDMKDADDQIADAATTPDKEINLMIACAPTDFSDTTSRNIAFRLKIEFQVELFELNNVLSS